MNDPPTLEVYLDSYTFDEDTEDYMPLSPLFVGDSDAGSGLKQQTRVSSLFCQLVMV